jgi:hypothetical protein
MSLGMGSIVAKTGCKIPLFLVQSFPSLGGILVEFQNKVPDILVLFSKWLLKNYELADDFKYLHEFPRTLKDFLRIIYK